MKQLGLPIPWQFWNVRDARTVYSLYPDLPKPRASHHALEDCRRQIDLLQQTIKQSRSKGTAMTQIPIVNGTNGQTWMELWETEEYNNSKRLQWEAVDQYLNQSVGDQLRN